MSKIIEKCMLYQLNIQCETYNLLPDYQLAYHENYSCETCLLQLINDILWACEYQSVMSLTVMDLSATFDTVDHAILTSTLNSKFGIDNMALKWFNSYLQPRSFKVVVNGKYSEEKQLTYSVPQGSCSGAYLFNLHFSKLNDVVPLDLHLSGFADDHSVRKEFKANDKSAELQTKKEVEECMVDVRSWMDQVRLKMNSAKTSFIYFGSRIQLSKCVVIHPNVNSELVERATLIKYPRAWLDAQLSFKEHTTKVCQTAIINYLHVRNICHLLTDSVCETLLLSLCVSPLDYANALLYGLPAITIDKFQRIQNMCASESLS